MFSFLDVIFASAGAILELAGHVIYRFLLFCLRFGLFFQFETVLWLHISEALIASSTALSQSSLTSSTLKPFSIRSRSIGGVLCKCDRFPMQLDFVFVVVCSFDRDSVSLHQIRIFGDFLCALAPEAVPFPSDHTGESIAIEVPFPVTFLLFHGRHPASQQIYTTGKCLSAIVFYDQKGYSTHTIGCT